MQNTLRLILGDQLDDQHSWFETVDPHVTYTMMEVRQETDYVVHHIQKVAAFFKAMRAFADHLESKGHRVIYFRLDDRANAQSIAGNITSLIEQQGFKRFEYQTPDEYRLRQEFSHWTARLSIETRCCDSEHFLSNPEEFKQLFKGKKRFIMESFYRFMRKKYNILLTDGKPEGGKWNYDQQNRNRYDQQLPLPAPLCFANDVREIVKIIEDAGIQTMGRIDPQRLIWPIDKSQAQDLLDYFLSHCLAGFGTYQDAMSTQSWSLFHGRLSFALNVKLLHPADVIQSVLDAYRQSEGTISIAQVEGFIRQILGWREYIRCMYWHLMPKFAQMNYFENDRVLPDFYWTGRTKMRCLRLVIDQSLQYAYAHHIQRLMITGNFALLIGVAPAAVEKWYLGIYIDAVQWVELPNTLGMSQFADGGKLATKPYASSGRYINRMSDYCGACDYRIKDSIGKMACPFNALYWHFLDRNRTLLGSNARMGMMYRVWDKMDAARRKAIRQQASSYLAMIDQL